VIAWLVVLCCVAGYVGARIVDWYRAQDWKPREALPFVQNGELRERFAYNPQHMKDMADRIAALVRRERELLSMIHVQHLDESTQRLADAKPPWLRRARA